MKFFSNQWAGICSLLLSSIFFGLWYTFSQAATTLSEYLRNSFTGGLDKNGYEEYNDYQFYSTIFIILAILLVVLGGYIIRNYYLRTKVKF